MKIQDYNGLKFYALGDVNPKLPAVFTLHGYGADAKDLIPLFTFQEFHETQKARWFFLQGPVTVPVSPYQNGYGWFDLDMEQLFAWSQTADLKALAAWRPPGLSEIAGRVAEFIRQQTTECEKVIVGGFSQGSMTVLDAALSGMPARALFLLSSTWVGEKTWLEGFRKHPLPPVFQSHGQTDPILPFGAAERLHQVLLEHKVPTEFHPFRGGHEIPIQVLESLHAFLARALQ